MTALHTECAAIFLHNQHTNLSILSLEDYIPPRASPQGLHYYLNTSPLKVRQRNKSLSDFHH